MNKYTTQQKELLHKLRLETGLGLMACSKCLIENKWNYIEAKKNYKKFQWDGKLYKDYEKTKTATILIPKR